jgi:hypothetical protein
MTEGKIRRAARYKLRLQRDFLSAYHPRTAGRTPRAAQGRNPMALVEQPAGTAAHAYEYAGAPFPAPAPTPARRAAAPAIVPSAPPAIQVSVVIVNFCQWKNTARLVRQLRRSSAMRMGEAEVRVVDNASPPHTLASRLGKIRGVSVRTNVGYAPAEGCGVPSRFKRRKPITPAPANGCCC